MTALTIVFLLTLALSMDYLAAGPDRVRDKIAFLLAVPAIRAGWDGSTLDHMITDQLRAAIMSGLQSSGPALSGAHAANAVIRCILFFVLLYTVGMLCPDKWSRKLGRWATLGFAGKGSAIQKLNPKMWAVAVTLGLLGDQLGGLSGALLNGSLALLTSATAGLPAILVGGV